MPPTASAPRLKSFDDPRPHGQTPPKQRRRVDAAPSPTGTPYTRRQDLQSRVVESLISSGYAALTFVGCEVDHNRVILHGCVPSYHLKQLAQVFAQRVEGIGRVENLLEVRQL
ncbi:MAG: BON domain-containing protein [Pirellulales bacterium]|nr:BON domain-containing protein [Pirellulales bacterium]